LKKKRWKGDEKCQFYVERERESADHLLFRCLLVVYIWVVIRDVLGWKALPSDVKSFVEGVMSTRGDKHNGSLIFMFGVVSWTL
jgi:hypothetical protein